MNSDTVLAEIVVPWTPPSRCNPNNHACSERTKIRDRKKGAVDATYPIREYARSMDAVLTEAVVLDLVIRWPKGRKLTDSDNIVPSYKYIRDVLEREGVVANDKLIQVGNVYQEFNVRRPETVLVLRAA